MAMSDEDRHYLQGLRNEITKNIGDVGAVVGLLGDRHVITEYMEETIMSKSTKREKAWELLSIIPTRGRHALQQFYDVLVEAGETAAADVLFPNRRSQRIAQQEQRNQFTTGQPGPGGRGVSEVEGPSNPEQETDIDPDFNHLSMKTSPVEDDLKNKFDRLTKGDQQLLKETYSVTKPDRGLCVIVKNEQFTNSQRYPDLSNVDMDVQTFMELFEKLHFSVEIKLEKEKGLRSILDKYSTTDHSNYDCFVLCVISYGTSKGVITHDGSCIEYEDIARAFDTDKCATLKDKPRLFFFQSYKFNEESSGDGVDGDISKIHGIGQGLTYPDSGEGRIAVTADRFLAIAHSSEVVMEDDTVQQLKIGLELTSDVKYKCSVFVYAVAYVFSKYSHKLTLKELITKVKFFISHVSRPRHLSCYSSTVVKSSNSQGKDFYFFPGLKPTLNQEQPSPTLNQVQPSDA